MKIVKTENYKKYKKAQNEWNPDEQNRIEQQLSDPAGKANEKYEREADNIINKKTVDLLGRYIGDGYLAYAEYASKSEAHSDRYWPDYYDSDQDAEESETILLKNVPIDIAEKLLAQGSSDQSFSDGYEAANAAAPYVVKENSSYNEEIREQFPDTPRGLEDDNPVQGIDY